METLKKAKEIIGKYAKPGTVMIIDIDGALVNKTNLEGRFRIESAKEIVNEGDDMKNFFFPSREEAHEWIKGQKGRLQADEEVWDEFGWKYFYRDYEEDPDALVVDAKEAWDYLFEDEKSFLREKTNKFYEYEIYIRACDCDFIVRIADKSIKTQDMEILTDDKEVLGTIREIVDRDAYDGCINVCYGLGNGLYDTLEDAIERLVYNLNNK